MLVGIFILMIIHSKAFAMEAHPSIPYEIKKYSCCPDDFGYQFKGMDPVVEDKELVYLCDFEQTRNSSDELFFSLNNVLFKRLMLELSYSATPQARASYKQLIDRLLWGLIKMDSVDTSLSHKDMYHRILSHLPGCKSGMLTDILLRNHSIGLIFTPCIHHFTAIPCTYIADKETKIFGNLAQEEFEQRIFRPVPSLLSLCVPVVKIHRNEQALTILPQELKLILQAEQ